MVFEIGKAETTLKAGGAFEVAYAEPPPPPESQDENEASPE